MAAASRGEAGAPGAPVRASSGGGEGRLYFAYGSNLCEEDWNERRRTRWADVFRPVTPAWLTDNDEGPRKRCPLRYGSHPREGRLQQAHPARGAGAAVTERFFSRKFSSK